MALEEWGRLVPRRFGRYLTALFRGGGGDLLIEDDPVGEFLTRKGEGAGQSEDEESPMPAMANPEPQAAGVGLENVEARGPVVVEREQSPDGAEKLAEDSVETSLDGNEERVARLEDEAGEIVEVTDAGLQALVADNLVETSPDGNEERVPQPEDEAGGVVAVSDAGEQAPEAESESVEMAVTSEAEPQTLEAGGQSAEAADPAQREVAAEDGEVDSLLEVFKSEQLSESPISALSRELSDTSVYSLLEDMKRIADNVRKRH